MSKTVKNEPQNRVFFRVIGAGNFDLQGGLGIAVNHYKWDINRPRLRKQNFAMRKRQFDPTS